jgi:UDP-glucuronate 4-epimerase
MNRENKLIDLVEGHRIDVIIHLAAKTGVRDSEILADSYFSSNILASKSIFSIGVVSKTPIIYASSSSVYGDLKVSNFSEDLKTQTPQSIYALSKIATENLGYYYTQKYNLNSVGLRFFTVYGPLPRKDMALWKFLEKIDSQQPITVYGKGEMVRDFTYVDDITEGILKTINLILDGQSFKNEVFNLCYGNGRKVSEMIEILEDHLGKKAIIQYEEKSYEDMNSTMANTTKANQILGFNPKYSLEEGIKKTMDWYLQNIKN